jgi:antitoxin ParD1/3/4
MSVVKTTLSLTEQDRKFMDAVIASGEYVSSSEYVRSLIRKDKEQRTETPAEIQAIRAKLIEAEKRGFTDMSVDEIWEEARRNA